MLQPFTFLNPINQDFDFRLIYFQAVKRFYPIIFIGLLLLTISNSCTEKDTKANPEDYFTESQKKAILMQLVLKTASKPKGNPEHSEIEAYYQSEAQAYYWHFAHEKDGRFYFYISKCRHKHTHNISDFNEKICKFIINILATGFNLSELQFFTKSHHIVDIICYINFF